MLKIVHPQRGGQGADPPTRRKRSRAPSLFLTPDEARHLRAATRNIARVRFGSLTKLAAALGVNPQILTRKRAPTPGLAVALWRLTGTTVEELLRPQLVAAPSPTPAPKEGGAA
jgi:hypothetical protein